MSVCPGVCAHRVCEGGGVHAVFACVCVCGVFVGGVCTPCVCVVCVYCVCVCCGGPCVCGGLCTPCLYV